MYKNTVIIMRISLLLPPLVPASWAGRSASPSPTIVSTSTSAIPRPISKLQFSTTGTLAEVSPIKLRPVQVHAKLTRESTNPFLSPHPDEEQQQILPDPTSPLPDLISDSLVGRRLHSSSSSSAATSESATPPCSLNPFCVSPQESATSTTVVAIDEEVWSGRESSPSDTVDTYTVLQHPIDKYDVGGSEPLIFNFDSAAQPTVSVVGVVAARATGAPVFSGGDLITLDMEQDEATRGACESDENVVNALREAEGSIRKLELASRQEHDDDDHGQDQDEYGENGGGGGGGRRRGSRRRVSMVENGLATKNFLINNGLEMYRRQEEEEEEDDDDNDHPTRMMKYEDSFMSDPHEELLLMNYQRRFRSHSETEATIFDRLVNQQQRRMMLSNNTSNNPFLVGPDLLHHESSPSSRSQLIRSSGMLIQQSQQEGEGTNNNCYAYNSGPGAAAEDSCITNPTAILRTVSETYLGQFRATSALPRSSSILQLLEQHHHHHQHYGQPPPLSPTLPRATTFMESNGGGRGRAGKERNSNSNSNNCMKSGGAWGKHSTSAAGSEKANVFGDSATAFKRTLSSESVSSQSSVLIGDLESSLATTTPTTSGHNPLSLASTTTAVAAAAAEEGPPPVTGYLCVGLQYDK